MEQQLAGMLQDSADDDLFRAIVNVPFRLKVESALMFLGIIVLLLADKKTKIIYRVAMTDNELAEATKKVSVKRFRDIKVPISSRKNIIAKVIRGDKPAMTTDWKDLFIPALTPAQARINQANAGIACSAVYPLTGLESGGALIFSFYQYIDKINAKTKKFMDFYAKEVSAQLNKRPSVCQDYLQSKALH